MHGLISGLAARSHEVSVLSLASPAEDLRPLTAETSIYASQVTVVPSPAWGMSLRERRIAQLRSLASLHSFEWHQHLYPPLQAKLDQLLRPGAFDVVSAEFAPMAGYRYGDAGGARLVLDEHNIEYDIVRRTAARERALLRKGYAAINWRKLRREERSAWRRFDGCVLTSVRDQHLLLESVPGTRTAVVPNAVDLHYFQPGPDAPPPDRAKLLFFGALNYYPNEEGLIFFLDEIWPLLRVKRPALELQIVGQHPPESIRRRQAPGIEITGRVDDLRPFLSRATAVLAPLRIGGGTRLKILEAMAMGRPVVSTSLGAEGLDVKHDRHLLLADDPASFAAQLCRLLDEPKLAAALGAAAHQLILERYGWAAAVTELENFYASLAGSSRQAA